MIAARVATGLGLAALGPSIFAAVGDLFPYAERGRAYGWTIGANTLSSIIGIPLATLLAAVIDWRWSFAAVAVLTSIAAVVLLVLFRPAHEPGEAGSAGGGSWAGLLRSYRHGYGAVLRTPTALAIFGSTFAQAVGLMAFETYLGALLITRYGIGTGELAPIFGAAGVGTLLGSQIGGRGLLNFLRNVPMGMRFTSASAIISEAVPGARATMNSLNQSCFNLGVMVGSSLGGVVVESVGYSAVSLMTVVGSIISALLITFFVTEHRPSGQVLQEEEAATAAMVPRPT
jgi:predicted MFS family arabinose efflux permease